MYINRTTFYSGLFGFINNGQISNVYVNGNIIGVASSNNLGGIVGKTLNASIINSHFTGEIITNTSAWGWIGGITGYLEDANPSSHNTFIINCSSNVNISEVGASESATIYIGGLVGDMEQILQIIFNRNVNGTGVILLILVV